MDESLKQQRKLQRRMAAQRKRNHNVLLAFAFLLVLLIFAIINLCVKDKEFSDTENRSLAQKPEFSWETLADGSYFSGLTDHFSDQFFLRDSWISLKLREESLLGRKESGGVYLCKNNYLIAQPETPNDNALVDTIDAINRFAAVYSDISMYMIAVPSAASILSDYLPDNAPVFDQLSELSKLETNLEDSVVFLDAVTPLQNSKSEDIYYKTDHHWTSLGAYNTFKYNAETMGLDADMEYDIYTVTNSFEGTLASKSGKHAALDHIEIYAPKSNTVEYYVLYPDGQKICSIYRSECLNVKDKYTVFFGGNHSIVEVKTTANNDKNLLLFKDSYANSFVEFLIPYYENIIMIDPRYYYDSIGTLMTNYSITDVLYLYSADTLFTDTALADVLTSGIPAIDTVIKTCRS